MAKKKRKSAPPRRARPTPPARRGTPSEAAAIGSVLGLPVMSGPSDDELAWEYLYRFQEFEHWIQQGGPPPDADFSHLPPAHVFMLDRWPDAFEMYRHATWVLLERVNKLNPWSATVRSLLTRAESADSSGAAAFSKRVDDGQDRFKTQRDNAVLAHEALPDHATLRERVRGSLHVYAAFYEIDFIAWFLAVLGKALVTGTFDPEAFGGPTSNTAQGSLIDHVVSSLDATPLGPLVRSAYLPELRNAIGHNTYEIEIAEERVVAVRDSKTGESWPGQVVFDAITGLAGLVNAVHTVVAYRQGVFEPREEGRFVDVGVVSVAFELTDDTPRITIFQLWCFHDVDPDGRWLDAARVTIRPLKDGRDEVRLTANTATVGEPVADTAFGEAVRRRGWVHVSRVAVIPALGLGHPRFTVGNGTPYEVVGLPDEHVVPVEIDQSPATLPTRDPAA